jgi:hypothetical protein
VHDCRGADGGGDAMRAFLATTARVRLHCGRARGARRRGARAVARRRPPTTPRRRRRPLAAARLVEVRPAPVGSALHRASTTRRTTAMTSEGNAWLERRRQAGAARGGGE